MIIPQLCRWKFSHKNLVADIIRLDLNFIKQYKNVIEPPSGGYRGNVRSPSIARYKARDQLLIRHNFFAISYS